MQVPRRRTFWRRVRCGLFLTTSALAGCRSSHEAAVSAVAGSAPAGSAPSVAASAVLPAASVAPDAPFRPQRVDYVGAGLGTRVQFAAYTTPSQDGVRVRDAFRVAIAEMQRLERLLSTWRPDSDVGRVNATPGQFVVVSEETAKLVERALWISERSLGAFDVTFHVLSDLWKFGDAAENPPRVPTRAAVDAARVHVDYRRVALDVPGRRVKLGEGQRMGLDGMSKGYIVDQMAAALRRAGLREFLVQAGGDLYGAGKKPDGTRWESGIQDPRAEIGTSFAKLELEDAAFSTAGDYARAFIVNGKRYHHIIDPKTGYPATASRSVTIWAPTALLADLIDDAVFIIGPKLGLELVESLDGVGAVIVDQKNQLWISQRLREKVKVSGLPKAGP
jgi:thiamine biosynthesis lipoprotein